MSQSLGVLLAIAFVALFASLIVRAVRRERQRIAAKTQLLASLGFQVVHPPEPSLDERIARLRARFGRGQYRIRYCAVQKSWDYSAYVLDIWKRSGKNSRLADENAMLFVSTSLRLPRFVLIPRPKMAGFVGGLLDSLTEKLLAQQGGRVEFPQDPIFSENFIVAGENHDAIRQLLSGQIMDFMTSHDRYQVEADGDTVMISEAKIGTKRSAPSEEILQRTVSEATSLYELLAKK